MKKATLFLILLLLTQTGHAQIDWGKYAHSFPKSAMDKASTVVGIITAIPKPNDSYLDMRASTDKLAELANDSFSCCLFLLALLANLAIAPATTPLKNRGNPRPIASRIPPHKPTPTLL